MARLDAATTRHMLRWLNEYVCSEEHTETIEAINRALDDDPDLIERGLSWPEIAKRGRED